MKSERWQQIDRVLTEHLARLNWGEPSSRVRMCPGPLLPSSTRGRNAATRFFFGRDPTAYQPTDGTRWALCPTVSAVDRL